MSGSVFSVFGGIGDCGAVAGDRLLIIVVLPAFVDLLRIAVLLAFVDLLPIAVLLAFADLLRIWRLYHILEFVAMAP